MVNSLLGTSCFDKRYFNLLSIILILLQTTLSFLFCSFFFQVDLYCSVTILFFIFNKVLVSKGKSGQSEFHHSKSSVRIFLRCWVMAPTPGQHEKREASTYVCSYSDHFLHFHEQ